MKRIVLLGTLAMAALLAGCESAQQNTELTTCQQEKMQLQADLEKANATIAQKDQKIEKMKDEVRNVNQKALESIRTMMEKQNAKDIELKNKIKDQDAQIKELQEKLNTQQGQ